MKVIIVAGEASGDILGASIVRRLREQEPGIRCLGVTGPRMQAAGCESIASIDALSVMGLVEILRELPRLFRFRRQLIESISAEAPDVVVTIDAPDFNLGLGKRLRALGMPVVHVVSPTVWAWREGRKKTVARSCDRLLCLYPFEPACYEGEAVVAEYIGHPLADELDDRTTQAEARSGLGIDPAQRVIGVLPGSRHGEVSRLIQTFVPAVERLAAQSPGVLAVVPIAHPSLRSLIETHCVDRDGLRWMLLDAQSREAMQAADVLLLASGTVTLEALLLGRPMVVAYRVAPLTAWLLRGLGLLKISHVSLPNLLSSQPVVPELLQQAATPEAVSGELLNLWRDPAARHAQTRHFSAVRDLLARDAASCAAQAIVSFVSARK
jgi:lipid-A-disaccharide synthase